MKSLILITSEFPYYSGEPFLENELPRLSRAFDQIYLFSINGNASETFTRNIPENATCFPLKQTTSKAKYMHYLCKGLFCRNSVLRIHESAPKRIAASIYTRGRASAIAAQIYSIIEDKKLKVDDAVVYSFWFAYQALAACLLSDKLVKSGCSAFAISRAHGYDLYWERVVGGYLPFQDSLLHHLKWCFPCSEFGRKYLLEKYPWADSKVRTARLGTVDHGVNPYNGEKTLVTCCNLEPLKRMRLFAEAFCELAKEYQDLKWICIGAGEDEEEIVKVVTYRGIADQLIMTGRLSNKSVMELYQRRGAMYFCNVSISEGLPVSIMEAMSFGIPIIATDVGGTSELVDSENGALIPAELDSHELAGFLRKMINKPYQEYTNLRMASRAKWEKLASAEVNYAAFCEMMKA